MAGWDSETKEKFRAYAEMPDADRRVIIVAAWSDSPSPLSLESKVYETREQAKRYVEQFNRRHAPKRMLHAQILRFASLAIDHAEARRREGEDRTPNPMARAVSRSADSTARANAAIRALGLDPRRAGAHLVIRGDRADIWEVTRSDRYGTHIVGRVSVSY